MLSSDKLTVIADSLFDLMLTGRQLKRARFAPSERADEKLGATWLNVSSAWELETKVDFCASESF